MSANDNSRLDAPFNGTDIATVYPVRLYVWYDSADDRIRVADERPDPDDGIAVHVVNLPIAYPLNVDRELRHG